ncbi:MSANTD3.2 family protein [Megaselia abdita]
MEKNPFFNEDEVVLLLQLVKKYPQIHTSRTDQTALKEKTAAWEMITEEFNEVNSIQRDTSCLKVKFRGVKAKFKFRKAAEKRETGKGGRKQKTPAGSGRKTILCAEAEDILESILKDLEEGVFEDMVLQADLDLNGITQDHQELVEYDPDVDVDGLEDHQPYMIEYLEEEIPYQKSSQIDVLRSPPKEIKKEVEKPPVKKEAPVIIRREPVQPAVNKHKSILKNQPVVKNQTFVKTLPVIKTQPPIVRNIPITRKETKAQPVVRKEPPKVLKTQIIVKKDVPKPIIKKEVVEVPKKPAEKPQPLVQEARRNPPREVSINKRRYTTSQLDEYLDSDSIPDEEEDYKIKKRRLTFNQQQKSLVDSLGMEEEEEVDIQVPTSTSTQKQNSTDDEAKPSTIIQNTVINSSPLKQTLPLADAQAEYYRDKNIREEKQEQRQAEEHKLKMKKLWLDIRKTLLEINALENDNIDCEQ